MDTDIDFESFAKFVKTFEPGEIIFSEFEPANTFYIIRSGKVHLVKNSGEDEKVIDVLFPPDMFGEMAISENSPRTATAVATDKVTVIEIDAKNFEIIMLGNPDMAFKLLRVFCKRVYDCKRRFMIRTLPDPKSKVAGVFLMLDDTRPNIDKTNDSREFQVSVEDIASWAGTDIAVTKDVLSGFVSANGLEIHKNSIIVKNINDFTNIVKR